LTRWRNGQGRLVKSGNSWSLILKNGRDCKWYRLFTGATGAVKILIEKLKEESLEEAIAKAVGLDSKWQ